MMIIIIAIFICSTHYLIMYFRLFFISFANYFVFDYSSVTYLSVCLYLFIVILLCIYLLIYLLDFQSVLDKNLNIWVDCVNIIHLITGATLRPYVANHQRIFTVLPIVTFNHSHPDSKKNRASHNSARHQLVPCH